jgi:hypothetical protein
MPGRARSASRGTHRFERVHRRVRRKALYVAAACFATYQALAVYDSNARQVFDRLSDEYRTLNR